MNTWIPYGPIALLLTFLNSYTFGQTTLYPGDLAVVGVNVQNGDCGSSPGEDLIQFVCLKTIQTGTPLDLTDNGWERRHPGTFGNSEGFLRIERTGPDLPAGTIITLRHSGHNGTYQIIAPDTAWTYTQDQAAGNSLNLSSGGDQLFFMQGGNWSNGSSSGFGGFSQDAAYDEGRMLYAFNTADDWRNFQDDSQQSGLPPGLQDCFHFLPNNGPADFLAYLGPMDPVSPSEWIERLRDPSFWQSFESCSAYPSLPQRLEILETAVDLDCRYCGSCEAYDETIYFRLPETGGPFDLLLTLEQDTLLVSGLTDEDSLVIRLEKSSRVDLLAYTNSEACTFIPAADNGFDATIEPLQYEYQFNGSACDVECYRVDFSFQGKGPFLLRYYFSHQDSSEAKSLIALNGKGSLDICPQDFPSGQEPIDLLLLSLKDLNCTLPLNDRIEVFNGGARIRNFREQLCEEDFRLINGQVYDVNRPTGQEIIPGGATNGCDSIINIALTFSPSLVASISGDTSICAGQSGYLTINLSASGTYSAEIKDDQAGLYALSGLVDGQQIEVHPRHSTTYELVGLESAESGCIRITGATVDISVNDLMIDITPAVHYNGFGLSCAEAQDGALSVSISGGREPYQINWSTGAMNRTLTDLPADLYSVTVADQLGCSKEDFYSLEAPEPLQLILGRDSSGCGGSSAALLIENIRGGIAPYELSTDGQFFTGISSFPHSHALDSGQYELTIQDVNDCQIRQTLTIGEGNKWLFDLGEDIPIFSGDSVLIEAFPTETPLAITWINADAATFVTELSIRVRPQRSQTYGLRLEYPGGCTVEDYLRVEVDQSLNVYYPNAFSPNEDGINDRFTLFGGSRVQKISYLGIYSRWGDLLFEQKDSPVNSPLAGWDGTYRQQPADSGTYYFEAELEYGDGRREVIRGSFLLLR